LTSGKRIHQAIIMGFYYNKKMKVRSTSTSGSESSGSDSERFSSSGTNLTDNETKFAGARFTSPPVPDAVPMPPKEWLPNKLTTVTSDLKSMLQIRD
jgi:hypothetical protein